eukprot:1771949-Rhodomonas_salina.4
MSLGFQYEYRRGRPVVTSVDPRGPAETAGIRDGRSTPIVPNACDAMMFRNIIVWCQWSHLRSA